MLFRSERVGFLEPAQAVVVAFADVLEREAFQGVAHLAHDQMVVRRFVDGDGGGAGLDGAEDVHREHRMVGGQAAPGLGHDVGLGDLLLLADLLDGVDQAARVLIERVVDRMVVGGLRAVVVDAEPPAAVQRSEERRVGKECRL